MPRTHSALPEAAIDEPEHFAESEVTDEAKEELADIARALEEATRGSQQYLSEKTARRWYQEARQEESPRAYFEDVIRDRMERAEQVRIDFDEVTEKLKNQGITPSFAVLSPEKFWKLSGKERRAYLEEAQDTLEKQRTFESRWKTIAEKVREFTHITFDELHAASKKETQQLLDGLKYKPKNEKELEGWEKYVEGTMQDQIQSARELYYERFMNPLLEELDKSVSARTIKELQEKFWDENVGYKEKERYILTVLPERIGKWKAVRQQRERLLKHPGLKKLKSGKVKGLSDFLDNDKFLALKYPHRKGIADMVESILNAQDKNMEQLHRTVEVELRGYVTDGRLHQTKVGTWLRRVFTADATVEGIHDFMKNTVRPYAENWKVARHDFNEVTKQMNKEGVPRGLRRLSLNQFLLSEYDQRLAYIDEAESRLKDNVNEKGPLADLRLDIRHAMDTGDWEEAETLLLKARSIAPDDKAVRSMARYFETHRPDEKEEKEGSEVTDKLNKASEALLNLRSIMNKLPSNMRSMTEKALHSSNPNTLKRLWQCFYNRHWVISNGYSTPLIDQKESAKESNKEQTAERIANGHEREFERNTIKNETANDAGILDECIEPQVLYTNRSGIGEVYEGVERNADNAQFGYWTTIVDDEVPYNLLREAVLNHMYDIKQNAKILRESGISYSSYGIPFSNN